MTTLQSPARAEEARAVVSSMIDAYGRKDENGYLGGYLQDDRLLVVGTGEEEWMCGIEQLASFVRRDFKQSKNMKVSHEVRHLQVFGDTVCCGVLCNASVEVEGGVFEIAGRFTLTLVKIEGVWQVVQSHFSAPLATQEKGNSFGAPNK